VTQFVAADLAAALPGLPRRLDVHAPTVVGALRGSTAAGRGSSTGGDTARRCARIHVTSTARADLDAPITDASRST
jgi:hypothetical protein